MTYFIFIICPGSHWKSSCISTRFFVCCAFVAPDNRIRRSHTSMNTLANDTSDVLLGLYIHQRNRLTCSQFKWIHDSYEREWVIKMLVFLLLLIRNNDFYPLNLHTSMTESAESVLKNKGLQWAPDTEKESNLSVSISFFYFSTNSYLFGTL